MKTHVEFAHPKLVVYRKLAIIIELDANHSQQPWKK
jgi:hypothetical protein